MQSPVKPILSAQTLTRPVAAGVHTLLDDPNSEYVSRRQLPTIFLTPCELQGHLAGSKPPAHPPLCVLINYDQENIV